MDKALKQRLVGASVLIALAVIVLPMLLGEPPEDTALQSQRIELPPRPDDLAFETRRFPLGAPGQMPPGDSGPHAGPEPAPAPAAADGGHEDPGPADANDMPPESSAEPSSGAQSAQEPVQAAEAAGGVRTLPPPKVEIEPAPDVEVLPPREDPAPGPAAASAGRYVVQVASLGSDANARKLMQTLQQSGFPTLLDSIESEAGRLSRVRVGPFDTESAASAALERIRASIDGVRPRLVDLRPQESSAVTHPGDPLVRWVVQVGSFSEAANAEGLVEKLRAGGLSAYRETLTSSGVAVHRVRVGPFLERADALGARQQLIDRHALEGVVMSAD